MLNILLIDDNIKTIELFKAISYNISNLNIHYVHEKNKLDTLNKDQNIHISFINSTLNGVYSYDVTKKIMKIDSLKNSYFILMTKDKILDNNEEKIIEIGIHEYLIKSNDINFENILKNKIFYFKKQNNISDSNIFILNENNQEIQFNNKVLYLTGFEYEILKFFIKNPMKYFSLQEISINLHSVLKTDISSDSVKSLIYRLRNKINSMNTFNKNNEYIISKRHFGYQFNPNGVNMNKQYNLLI